MTVAFRTPGALPAYLQYTLIPGLDNDRKTTIELPVDRDLKHRIALPGKLVGDNFRDQAEGDALDHFRTIFVRCDRIRQRQPPRGFRWAAPRSNE